MPDRNHQIEHFGETVQLPEKRVHLPPQQLAVLGNLVCCLAHPDSQLVATTVKMFLAPAAVAVEADVALALFQVGARSGAIIWSLTGDDDFRFVWANGLRLSLSSCQLACDRLVELPLLPRKPHPWRGTEQLQGEVDCCQSAFAFESLDLPEQLLVRLPVGFRFLVFVIFRLGPCSRRPVVIPLRVV